MPYHVSPISVTSPRRTLGSNTPQLTALTTRCPSSIPLRTISLNLEHSDLRTSLPILTSHVHNISERHNLL
ncbi:hypothetical protein A2U01_0072170, partial [Trifolium medium]|nr:hypothetical protein [Trifolium medium]